MSRDKRLIKNSLIFALGNIGSKLIGFIMIPLYTIFLSTSEYGEIDIINNLIALVFPIISCNLSAAAFRFSLEKDEDKSQIFSNVIITIGVLFFIFIVFYPLVNKISLIKNYILIIYVLLFVTIIQAIFKEFTRAIDELKVFILSDFIQISSFIILTYYFISILKLGVKGFLLAKILSLFLDTIVLFLGAKLNRFLVFQLNKGILKEMLIYSLPLVPNTIMWWINNVSDRYIIDYYLGISSVGIYGIACKFPTLLTTLNTIFFKAWQSSAVEEYSSNDTGKFYSKVFNKLSIGMFICSSGLIVVIRPLIENLLSDGFKESWRYVPILLISSVFYSLAGFLGSIYIASKQTKGAMISTGIAAFINVLLNIFLIPKIGIQGAGIATLMSLIVLFYIRQIDTKKFIIISYNYKKILTMLVINIIQIIFLLYIKDFIYSFIAQIILFSGILMFNSDEIFKVFEKVTYKVLGENK